MGDLAAAKRNLMWVKEAVSSARWDNYESQLTKVEQSLEGVPDAEKAAVVSELADLKAQAEKAMKAEKSGRVTRDLDRRIGAIDPRSLVDSALVSKLQDVLTRLGADEVTSVVEPSVIAEYRAKVEAMMPAAQKPAEKPVAAPAPKAEPAPQAAPAPAAVKSAPAPAPQPAAPAPAAAPTFDFGPVRRELMWLKDAASSRNWDRVEDQGEKIERMLAEAPAAEKAALVAEVAAARKEAQEGQKKEKAGRIVDEIERKISGADPRYNGPEQVRSMLASATERLDGEETKRFLSADVIAGLRDRIASVGGAAAAGEKSRYVEKVESFLKRFEDEFGEDPFAGRDDMEARRAHQQLSSHLTAARNNLSSLAPNDADTQRLKARIEAQQARIDSAWAGWEQLQATDPLVQWWQKLQDELAGWEAEGEGPSWEVFVSSNADGVTALNMPISRRATLRCLDWLERAEPVLATYPDDAALSESTQEAKVIVDEATEKLRAAFERLATEAEQAPLPTEKRELEKPQKLVQYVSSWFERTPHLEASQARARALDARWNNHLAELDRLGAELYAKLEAEALQQWPAIVGKLGAATDFDPKNLDAWKGKPVLISGVWNRSGWDFAGDFNFENRIDGVPVAGDWDKRIGSAFREAVARTRKSIDDHQEWDLVGVVKGAGEVKRRTQRELVVKGTNEKIKTESWEPEACVVIEIIAIRAGPVAIGPA